MKNLVEICGNLIFERQLPVIAAIGVFDGVHLGHRKIISAAAVRAAETGAKVLALSFKPHPRELLNLSDPPKLLVSESDRWSLLRDAGADVCAFINFNAEVAALAPEDFLEELKNIPQLDIRGICVGSNWRFGRQGSGNRATLEKFCRRANWSLDAVPELEMDGITVSSSAIRTALADGELAKAENMLGRKVSLTGVVEHGFNIASRKLDAPTANLHLQYGVMPPDGVYAGSAVVDGINYPAALNIGVAPTFGNDMRRIEIHLIGYAGDLYGRELSVKLHRFLRPERRFASPEELKKQIASDIAEIQKSLQS